MATDREIHEAALRSGIPLPDWRTWCWLKAAEGEAQRLLMALGMEFQEVEQEGYAHPVKPKAREAWRVASNIVFDEACRCGDTGRLPQVAAHRIAAEVMATV